MIDRHECPDCGRRHVVAQKKSKIECVVCGSEVSAGRGGKKFCSVKCRKSYWSYDRQKRYYREKRQDSRKRGSDV